MCRMINSILAVTAAGGLSGVALASRSPSIEGVWQAVEITTTGPQACLSSSADAFAASVSTGRGALEWISMWL